MEKEFSFQIKITGDDWVVIPEMVFYDSLYRHERKITPCIREMLKGTVLVYGNQSYRIVCMKG